MTNGSVYFAEISDGPVKIGWTSKLPAVRLAELQVGCPWKILLLGDIPGETRHEAALHRKYHSSKMMGEWFHRSSRLETEITEILSSDYRWPDASSGMASIIDRFGGAAEFGRAIKVPGFHAQTMKNRDSIPPRFWLRLVEASKARNIEGITLETLANFAAAKLVEANRAKMESAQ
jgi:hypothetical protein